MTFIMLSPKEGSKWEGREKKLQSRERRVEEKKKEGDRREGKMSGCVAITYPFGDRIITS